MDTNRNLNELTLADAWDEIKAHADAGVPLHADSYRFAFSDPEFLLRRETRGLRIQLELMKPDIEQQAQGVTHTIVVFGSARYVSRETALERLTQAQATGDVQAIQRAQRDLRNSTYYEEARKFGHLVPNTAHAHPTPKRSLSARVADPASWRQPTAAHTRPEPKPWG